MTTILRSDIRKNVVQWFHFSFDVSIFFVGAELNVAAQGKLLTATTALDYLPLKGIKPESQRTSETSSTTSVRRCNHDTVNPTLIQSGAGGV